jgi:hypothetical protein
MEKKITSHSVKGLIIAALLIILDLVFQRPGFQIEERSQYLLRAALVLVSIFISCIIFSKQSGGGLKFGDVFSHGFKTTAVIAFLLAIYIFIAVKYIYQPPTAEDIDTAAKLMAQQQNVMPQEAKRMAEEAAGKRWIIYVSLSFFLTLLPGLFGSLAGAAVAKKNQ